MPLCRACMIVSLHMFGCIGVQWNQTVSPLLNNANMVMNIRVRIYLLIVSAGVLLWPRGSTQLLARPLKPVELRV